MNNFCGAADPNIDKAVKLLQQYDVVSYNKFKNAQKETAQQPRSENSVKERNIKFRLTRKLHRKGKLSTEVYAQEILEIYKFVPKKKYVEDLADTEESDDTEIEDSSDDDENANESVYAELYQKLLYHYRFHEFNVLIAQNFLCQMDLKGINIIV